MFLRNPNWFHKSLKQGWLILSLQLARWAKFWDKFMPLITPQWNVLIVSVTFTELQYSLHLGITMTEIFMEEFLPITLHTAECSWIWMDTRSRMDLRWWLPATIPFISTSSTSNRWCSLKVLPRVYHRLWA